MPILRKRVKESSEIKQQHKTLITSKNLSPFQKTKLNNKVKIPSDKIETKKIMYKPPEKIWMQSTKKLGNN